MNRRECGMKIKISWSRRGVEELGADIDLCDT